MTALSQPAFPGIEGAGMTLRQWYAAIREIKEL